MRCMSSTRRASVPLGSSDTTLAIGPPDRASDTDTHIDRHGDPYEDRDSPPVGSSAYFLTSAAFAPAGPARPAGPAPGGQHNADQNQGDACNVVGMQRSRRNTRRG